MPSAISAAMRSTSRKVGGSSPVVLYSESGRLNPTRIVEKCFCKYSRECWQPGHEVGAQIALAHQLHHDQRGLVNANHAEQLDDEGCADKLLHHRRFKQE